MGQVAAFPLRIDHRAVRRDEFHVVKGGILHHVLQGGDGDFLLGHHGAVKPGHHGQVLVGEGDEIVETVRTLLGGGLDDAVILFHHPPPVVPHEGDEGIDDKDQQCADHNKIQDEIPVYFPGF